MRCARGRASSAASLTCWAWPCPAVLLPTFIAYAPDLRFEVAHGAPIRVARTADRDGDVRAAMENWVVTLEDAVRRWPTQWYTFYDFWPPEAGPA